MAALLKHGYLPKHQVNVTESRYPASAGMGQFCYNGIIFVKVRTAFCFVFM